MVELSKIQADLISSFLLGHWKEIQESKHKIAFEIIMEKLKKA